MFAGVLGEDKEFRAKLEKDKEFRQTGEICLRTLDTGRPDARPFKQILSFCLLASGL